MILKLLLINGVIPRGPMAHQGKDHKLRIFGYKAKAKKSRERERERVKARLRGKQPSCHYKATEVLKPPPSSSFCSLSLSLFYVRFELRGRREDC
ncbi:hypothetical protein M5K25_026191 [Dendrobium thyrsiflorum]|uniref:Uncharacterized protein n=1 Tax=Dendrobium thyrsiflorum TaxID=117978 RepID=A0ABD0TWT4_DENTH